MDLTHIVAATDESEAGRQAVRSAIALASRTEARVTVMQAVPARRVPAGVASNASVGDVADGATLSRLRRSVETDPGSLGYAPEVSFAVAHGLPGIEITRFAERERADLLVLGRKPRSLMSRLIVGDTTDAVARRSSLPCLFVPVGVQLPRSILVALDGTSRGVTVLTVAEDFARHVNAELHVVKVDQQRPLEPAHLAPSAGAQSGRLGVEIRSDADRELEVRYGDIVEEVLASVCEHRPDVLAIGYHRGGPPGIIDAGSTGRRLAHIAPCAVLTIPF